jgi:signal transduction protein with GAF and PtsI domain
VFDRTKQKNSESDKKKNKKICAGSVLLTMISDYTSWLSNVLTEFSCQTGTIHRSTSDGTHLDLVAQIGVPEFLLDKISYIPFGKGIAGAAAATREPVELCNLQQDLGGVARPDARQTKVSGSLAVPIFSADGSAVLGVLGVGMQDPHDFSDAEKQQLADFAKVLCEDFSA